MLKVKDGLDARKEAGLLLVSHVEFRSSSFLYLRAARLLCIEVVLTRSAHEDLAVSRYFDPFREGFVGFHGL